MQNATLYCSASSPHCSSSSHPQVPGHLFVGHRLWLDGDPQVRHQALPLLGSLNPGEALLPHQPREEVEDLHLSRYSGPEAGSVDELDEKVVSYPPVITPKTCCLQVVSMWVDLHPTLDYFSHSPHAGWRGKAQVGCSCLCKLFICKPRLKPEARLTTLCLSVSTPRLLWCSWV